MCITREQCQRYWCEYVRLDFLFQLLKLQKVNVKIKWKSSEFWSKIVYEEFHYTVHSTIAERFLAAPVHAGWSHVGGDYTLTYYRAWRAARSSLSVRSFRYCGMDCSTIMPHYGISATSHKYCLWSSISYNSHRIFIFCN